VISASAHRRIPAAFGGDLALTTKKGSQRDDFHSSLPASLREPAPLPASVPASQCRRGVTGHPRSPERSMNATGSVKPTAIGRSIPLAGALLLAACAALLALSAAPTLAAEACPNEARRAEQGTTGLGECRAYEKVSPAEKGFEDIVGDGLTTVASAEGDAVAFNSRAQFAGSVGSGADGESQYVAGRSSGGWSTRAITPMPRPDAVQTFFAPTNLQLFSEDLSTALVWAYDLPGATGGTPERNSMYSEDTQTRALQTITASQLEPLAPFDFGDVNMWGASADLRHVAFVAGTRLLPGALAGPSNLYKWDNGVLSLAGVLPDGKLSPGGATVTPKNYRGAMSADGSRLAFASPANGEAQLYLHIDGKKTVWVSEPEGSDQSTPTGVSLEGMTRDGHNVFFVTDSALVNSDTNGGADVYRYTDSVDPAKDKNNLTMISQNGDNHIGPSAGRSVVGFSEDGQRVYYNTLSAKLVLWDHGTTRVINSAVPRNQQAVTESHPGFGRVTPDGMYMAFFSNTTFDTVHGPTGEVTNGHFEAYLYSLKDDALRCVSCPSGGATGDASVSPDVTLGNPTIENVAIRPRFLDDSGRLYFSTPEALLPQDVNGVADTYSYDGASGKLSLLSTGRGKDPTEFADASASGDDVFLLTRQPLVGSDRDQLVDLYDARVGGGFPEPAAPPLPCAADGCQAPPGVPPSFSAPASASVASSGNLQPAVARPPVSAKPPTKAQKLARALHRCRAKHKRSVNRRCEASARKSFRRSK
jgi:hypothetical protein